MSNTEENIYPVKGYLSYNESSNPDFGDSLTARRLGLDPTKLNNV